MPKKRIFKSNHLILIILSIIILLLYSNFSIYNQDLAVLGIGMLSILHGTIYFVKHGGKIITPTAIFALTSALLVGFASIYITLNKNYNFGSELLYATQIGFIAQIIICNFSTSNKVLLNRDFSKIEEDKGTIRNINIISVTLVFIGFLGAIFKHEFAMFTNAFFYIGILMLVVIIWNKVNKIIKFKEIMVTVLLFLLYFIFVFDDFGRVILATLALGIAMGINHLFKKYNLKVIILMLLGPALIFAATLRESYSEENNPYYDPSSSTEGFGSMVSPLYTFGKLLKMYWNSTFDLNLGQTFFATLVIFIPRDLWEQKPYGFSRQITEIFSPEKVKVGHSDVSIVYGEWLYNFGFIGIVLCICSFIIGLRILDKLYIKSINNKFNSTFKFIQYIGIIIISAGIINIFWGGSTTFMIRDGFKILLIILIYVVFLIIPKKT